MTELRWNWHRKIDRLNKILEQHLPHTTFDISLNSSSDNSNDYFVDTGTRKTFNSFQYPSDRSHWPTSPSEVSEHLVQLIDYTDPVNEFGDREPTLDSIVTIASIPSIASDTVPLIKMPSTGQRVTSECKNHQPSNNDEKISIKNQKSSSEFTIGNNFVANKGKSPTESSLSNRHESPSFSSNHESSSRSANSHELSSESIYHNEAINQLIMENGVIDEESTKADTVCNRNNIAIDQLVCENGVEGWISLLESTKVQMAQLIDNQIATIKKKIDKNHSHQDNEIEQMRLNQAKNREKRLACIKRIQSCLNELEIIWILSNFTSFPSFYSSKMSIKSTQFCLCTLEIKCLRTPEESQLWEYYVLQSNLFIKIN